MAAPRGKGKSDSRKVDPKAQQAARKPPPGDVADFHSNSDLDSRPEAQHHSIGTGPNQAASGQHNHDGTDPGAPALWTGVNLTDPAPAATNAQLAAAISQLNALIRQKSA